MQLFLYSLYSFLISVGCQKKDSALAKLSERELIAFIHEKINSNLLSVSRDSERGTLHRVEACNIIFQYEVVFPSGETMLQEIYIPTNDLRIGRDGSVIYSQAVVSNCALDKDEEIQLRIKDKNIKIKNLENQDLLDLNSAIQLLNIFCHDSITKL